MLPNSIGPNLSLSQINNKKPHVIHILFDTFINNIQKVINFIIIFY